MRWPTRRLTLLLPGLFLGLILLPLAYTAGSRSYQEVAIPADGYTITGYLSPGSSDEGPWVVFAHGNRAEGQQHPLYQRLLRNLNDEATVLAVDMRGFGKTPPQEPEPGSRIWDRSDDLLAAVAFLTDNYGAADDRIILVGHSLGAVQALKAAYDRRFQRVIPIGMGDYDAITANERTLHSYNQKFERNSGLAVAPADRLDAATPLTPAALFTACPLTPVVLVYGRYDHDDTLLLYPEKVPDRCGSSVQWKTIPLSDHMYGTEANRVPRLLRPLHSSFSSALLIRQLNQLLRR